VSVAGCLMKQYKGSKARIGFAAGRSLTRAAFVTREWIMTVIFTMATDISWCYPRPCLFRDKNING